MTESSARADSRAASADEPLFSRRTVLAGGAAFALATALAPARAETRHPIGLQLSTVLLLLEQDFEGTLANIAKIGYTEVETLGALGRDPKRLRVLFEKYGLVSPSQHVMPEDLYDAGVRFIRGSIGRAELLRRVHEQLSTDRVAPIIEEAIGRARILGQKNIVWPMILPKEFSTRKDLDVLCRAFDLAGDRCAKAGLVFGFHNHAAEFAAVSGYIPYDAILGATNPLTVKGELDVFWAFKGKVDPAQYLARYPGRFVQCHLKDSTLDGDFAAVGQGVIDFPTILLAARKAGVQHYYVEYDRPRDPMEVSREAFEYLRSRL